MTIKLDDNYDNAAYCRSASKRGIPPRSLMSLLESASSASCTIIHTYTEQKRELTNYNNSSVCLHRKCHACCIKFATFLSRCLHNPLGVFSKLFLRPPDLWSFFHTYHRKGAPNEKIPKKGLFVKGRFICSDSFAKSSIRRNFLRSGSLFSEFPTCL